MKFYVAYGSNLNVCQMKRRCPSAVKVGTAMIRDYELLFKGSKTGAYLTIEKCEGGKVPVGIWAVSDDDEARLDRYEGYPAFYYKKNITLPVHCFNFNRLYNLECFVYIMHENRSIGIPSDFYVDTCAEGYEDFEFDHDYLIAAIERSEEALCHVKK